MSTAFEAAQAPDECPLCGSARLSSRWTDDSFEYGQETPPRLLTARIPVYTCSACAFSFTGAEAEVARHDAVCAHLGLLNPAQVRAVREGLGMSQDQFAQMSGFGKASLGRWERGELLPNRSSDNLLRLLAYPENVVRLQSASN